MLRVEGGGNVPFSRRRRDPAANHRVEQDEELDRHDEDEQAREGVQDALRGRFAEVVGEQHEHCHANDVGDQRDGHDRHEEKRHARMRTGRRHVRIDERQRDEAVDGIQARARVGDPGSPRGRQQWDFGRLYSSASVG